MSERNQTEFELYMEISEFEDGPIAVLGLWWGDTVVEEWGLEDKEAGRIELDPSHLPARSQPCGGRYRGTMTISSEPQDTGHEIGDLTSRLSFKAESLTADEISHQMYLCGVDSGEREGSADIITYSFPDDWSFPVLSDGDRAYISLELEYDLEWARSTDSPVELRDMWGYLDRTTPGVIPEWSVERESGLSAPISDGERVYARCADGSVSAFSVADGTTAWTFDVEEGSSAGASSTHPIVVDGTVYFGLDGDCYALDAATGTVEWRTDTVDVDSNSPELADVETVGEAGARVRPTLYVSGSTSLSALDPATGACQWSLDLAERIEDFDVRDGRAFASTRDKTLYGIDARTGDRLWRFDFEGRVQSGPVVGEGLVYFSTDESTSEGHPVYAVDTETGAPVWQTAVEVRPEIAGLDDDEIYVYSRETMYVLDAETGSSNREMSVPGSGNVVDGSLFSWSAMGGRNSGAKILSRIDEADGQTVQRYEVPSEYRTAVSLYPGFEDDVAYVSVEDTTHDRHWMTAVRFTDGTQLPLEGTVRSLGGEDDTALLSLDGAEDESLILSQACLPEYGRFEDARYELVISVDTDESAVANDRHYESDQVTVFAGEVTDVDDEQAILDLTALDRDGVTGTLRLDAERLPTDPSTVGDTGYVGVYHMLDEEATPDAAKPDEWY